MKLLNLNLDLRFPKRYWLKKPSLTRRLWILRREVCRLKPDFLTFQEVTDAVLLGDLKAMLFYPYSFVVRGIVRIYGGLTTGFDYTRWRFVYKKFIPFAHQGRFFSKEIADRLLRKGILLTIFDRRQTGERVVIVNVHLTANYGRKKSDEERKVLKIQLAQLQKLLEDKRHIGRWQIIAGDYNADFTSGTMQDWLAQLNTRLVFPVNACTICPHINPLCHPDQRVSTQVDNIFYFGAVKRAAGKMIFNSKGKFISDHIGQLADFS